MPSILIELRTEHGPEIETALMEAVHSSLIECFKIRATDRNVRLLVHQPHRFQCPPDRAKPELYTHISIDCFAGRSIEAKRALYKSIVSNLSDFGIPADHIKIMLREIEKQNWGIRGGYAACDIDLGFKIEV